MVTGIGFIGAYCHLHPAAITGPQLTAIQRALAARIEQLLLIIQDGLRALCPRMVRDYVETLGPAAQ